MRNRVMASGAAGLLAGVAMTAQAQQSAWGYFEAEQETDGVRLLQAGVVGQDGAQLILKCDEPGENTVLTAIAVPEQIAPPQSRPSLRPVKLQFDDGPVEQVQWRYYPNSVVALNTRRERTLEPFITDLADAQNLEVTLEPVDGVPLELEFNVTGARDAITRVFERCGDVNPLS